MRKLFKPYHCEAAEKQLDAFLDGELTTKQTRDLSAHLASCSSCREALEARKKLKKALKTGEQTVPPALHDAVMRRIQEEKQCPPVRFSRPRMALVGSLCAVVLVVGVMLSPFGDMVKGGMTAEDAVMSPSAAGKPNHSYTEELDEVVSGLKGEIDKDMAESTDPSTNETYSVKDSNVTVSFATGGVAFITGEDGKRLDGTYKVDEDTVTVTLGEHTAVFMLAEDVLILVEGKLFD